MKPWILATALAALVGCAVPTPTPPVTSEPDPLGAKVTFGFVQELFGFGQESASLSLGNSLTLTPTFEDGSQWHWYVDDVGVADTASYTFTPSEPGVYSVAVLVVRKAVAYSASLSVTVSQ